jgi:hypothetical protein
MSAMAQQLQALVAQFNLTGDGHGTQVAYAAGNGRGEPRVVGAVTAGAGGNGAGERQAVARVTGA